MKTLKLFGIAVVLFLASNAFGQVSVNVNIGTPPLWGPVGYSDVRYYYLPDIETYYDIQSSMFVYYEGGFWVHRAYLPGRYRNYDLYNGYKVVVPQYRGAYPTYFYKYHKSKYGKGYRGGHQRTFGENPRNNKYKGKNVPGGNHNYNRGNAPGGNHNFNSRPAPGGNHNPKMNNNPGGNHNSQGRNNQGGGKGKGGGKGRK